MKRPQRAWPTGIVEVPSRRPDPRTDPQATQKISREELEDALRRTKSGMRRAVRSEPEIDRESFVGPRDDGPEITIVRIDSVELSVIDPASFPPPSASPTPPETSPIHPAIATSLAAPRRRVGTSLTQRLHITPRLAFLAGVGLVVFVTLAALVGFFAGRITGH